MLSITSGTKGVEHHCCYKPESINSQFPDTCTVRYLFDHLVWNKQCFDSFTLLL